MKKLYKLLFILILLITSVNVVSAKTVNLVNIYLFYSSTCSHCHAEMEYLKTIESQYENVVIYKYEISEANNVKLLDEISELYDTTTTGVPFTIIGDKYFKGFSESYRERFTAAIDYYSTNMYVDKAGMHIGGIPLPQFYEDDPEPTVHDNPTPPPVIDDDKQDEGSKVSVDEYIEEKTAHKISILRHDISLKNMALPFVSALIGIVDGFNPCAMWVLLFLISMLIGMKDKKRMWIIGLSFLLTSAFIYLLFMLAWLNAATLLLSIKYVRIAIGLVALFGAIINLRSYIMHRKDNGCDVINDKKRNKIFDKIKKFTKEKSYVLAILGAMALAISVNVVELACSAGLPVMFIEILSMNALSVLEKALYIGIYMIFFLIDDFIVFFIAVRTMEVTGFSTRYGKISKLVGGLLLLGIGILLIFKPDWLMFNF